MSPPRSSALQENGNLQELASAIFPDRPSSPVATPQWVYGVGQAATSTLSSVGSGVSVDGAVPLPKCAPYLVLGFGTHSDASPLKSEVLISYPSQDYVPWSNEPIRVHGYAHTATISLPPCTQVVGSASGLTCFPMGSMQVIHLPPSRFNMVEFPDGSKYSSAKGIIYPLSYPTGGHIMMRRTKSKIVPHPKDILLSAGFALMAECKVAKEGRDISSLAPGRIQFSILSQDYTVRFVNGESAKLFHPFFMKQLPPCLLNMKETDIKEIRVQIRGLPYFAAIFCALLLAFPGVIQAYGSQDNQWGDIMNAVIGTGSVLVGVVLIAFQKISGFDVTSSRALRGFLTIQSNFGALLLARNAVKQIEEAACDPRIPDGLIAEYYNSAVRTDRTGWLKVGNSIKFSDMHRRGYHVLKDRGLVLDLINAWYYSCTKQNDVVIINRPGQEVIGDVCLRLEGNEVFE